MEEVLTFLKVLSNSVEARNFLNFQIDVSDEITVTITNDLSQNWVPLKWSWRTALLTAGTSFSLSLLLPYSALLQHAYMYCTTYTSRLPRLSSPGLESLPNQLSGHWVNYFNRIKLTSLFSSQSKQPLLKAQKLSMSIRHAIGVYTKVSTIWIRKTLWQWFSLFRLCWASLILQHQKIQQRIHNSKCP